MKEIEVRHDRIEPAGATGRLLTTEDVAHRLAQIHAVRDDDEHAHGKTDDLHRDVLAAIAAGAPDAQLLAAALRTETLNFARWTA